MFTVKALYFAIGLLCLSAISPNAIGQTTARGLGKVNSEVSSDISEGNYYLFVIGIDNYPKWMPLNNAVNDAEGIREVLMENFGFLTPVKPLYNDEATQKNIISSFDKLRKIVTKNDNLIIFFAGHGFTRVDTVGDEKVKSGYLIPYEAEDPIKENWSSYIGVNMLLSAASLLPVRHLTVILDACHSGIALGNSAAGYRSSFSYANVLNQQVSRRIITSARANQLAQDNGPIPDHSLFTGTLIDGVKKGKADLDANGMITTSELGLFLEQEVTEFSDGLQTPDFGSFFLDKRGEMVFSLNAIPTTVLINNLRMLFKNGKTNEFAELYPQLAQRDLPVTQIYDIKFNYFMIQGNSDKAEEVLNELIAQKEEIDQDKMQNVIEFKALYSYWKKYWGHLNPETNVNIELFVDGEPYENPETVSKTSKKAFLPLNCNYKFKLTNNTSKPLFIYAFYTDFRGKVETINLWKDLDITFGDGLPPGACTESHQLKNVRLKGMNAVKFFFSKEPIPEFMAPPSFIRADLSVPTPSDDLTSNTFLLIFK